MVFLSLRTACVLVEQHQGRDAPRMRAMRPATGGSAASPSHRAMAAQSRCLQQRRGAGMSAAAQRQNYTFFHSLRVRWAEVDPQGIVFNGNHLTYLDVATTEYYRQLGMSYSGRPAARRRRDLFAVKSTLEYRAPAHFDDWLDIGNSRGAYKGAAAWFSSCIWRDEQLLTVGELSTPSDANERQSQPRRTGCARRSGRSSDVAVESGPRRVAGRAARGRRHRFFPRLRGPSGNA
ncbi:hotdog domain-containing protein [Pseudomonas aeruginosa]